MIALEGNTWKKWHEKKNRVFYQKVTALKQ